jgi:hypothetical protein
MIATMQNSNSNINQKIITILESTMKQQEAVKSDKECSTAKLFKKLDYAHPHSTFANSASAIEKPEVVFEKVKEEQLTTRKQPTEKLTDKEEPISPLRDEHPLKL